MLCITCTYISTDSDYHLLIGGNLYVYGGVLYKSQLGTKEKPIGTLDSTHFFFFNDAFLQGKYLESCVT